MSLTIEAMLSLPSMENAVIQAGRGGMNRIVETVNVMDAPDIANWVKPNELILTTAYVIKDDIEAQVSLIEQLADRQCAGLAIKTKRYLDRLPPSLIRQADAHRLPLIELPLANSLGDIMNTILSHVLNLKQIELEKSFEIHRRFTSLFLKGANMSDIAQTLSGILHLPVAVLSPRLELIGRSGDFPAQPLLREGVQRIAEALHRGEAAANRLFRADSGHADAPDYGIYPVVAAQVLRGYIIVVREPDASVPVMPLEQAANVISYELIKQDARREGEKRLRARFFSELFDSVITSEEEIKQRCTRYGLREGGIYWVAVGRLDAADRERTGIVTEKRDERLRDLLEDQIEAFYQNSGLACVVSTQGDHAAIVFCFPEYDPGHEEIIQRSLGELRETIAGSRTSGDCSFGIGNYVDRLTKLPQAYLEASKALKYGYGAGMRGFTMPYRTHEVSELIRLIPHQKLAEFHRNALKSLAEPKDQEQRDLLRTLDTFLKHNCLVAETARILYIHRNTVFYRLNKCQEMLNVDLKDPVDTMKLRMALAIDQVLNVPQANPLRG